MGNPKQKWTPEEEEALRAGIDKHGVGKWKNIQQDPEFNHLLYFRSNIDLKDKWRNLSVSATGQGSRTPKLKSNPDAPIAPVVPAAAPLSSSPALAPPTIKGASAAHLAFDDKSTQDGKNAPVYNNMILDALSVLNDPKGSDTGEIVSFIEISCQATTLPHDSLSCVDNAYMLATYINGSIAALVSRQRILDEHAKRREEVPQSFRRLLSTRLRRLVAQEKIEKVQNRYKLKNNALFGTKTPVPKQKDVQPRHVESIGPIHSGDTIEEAAIAAAYRIAEAENKSFVASEAVKEAERVSKMAEESESVLYLAKEIFERCSRGEFVLMA